MTMEFLLLRRLWVTVALCCLLAGVSAYVVNPQQSFLESCRRTILMESERFETSSSGCSNSRSHHRYDLGLGKNPPVGCCKLPLHAPRDVQEAVKYWVSPEPVVSFPAPTLEPPPGLEAADTDLATILVEEDHGHHAPKKDTNRRPIPPKPKRPKRRIALKHPGQEVELNTIWVDALIHHVQTSPA